MSAVRGPRPGAWWHIANRSCVADRGQRFWTARVEAWAPREVLEGGDVPVEERLLGLVPYIDSGEALVRSHSRRPLHCHVKTDCAAERGSRRQSNAPVAADGERVS